MEEHEVRRVRNFSAKDISKGAIGFVIVSIITFLYSFTINDSEKATAIAMLSAIVFATAIGRVFISTLNSAKAIKYFALFIVIIFAAAILL